MTVRPSTPFDLLSVHDHIILVLSLFLLLLLPLRLVVSKVFILPLGVMPLALHMRRSSSWVYSMSASVSVASSSFLVVFLAVRPRSAHMLIRSMVLRYERGSTGSGSSLTFADDADDGVVIFDFYIAESF